MNSYKITLNITAHNYLVVDTIKAADENEALCIFLRKHYHRRAFFNMDKSLSSGGSRLFGQVFKRTGKEGLYGANATSLTGLCYIDITEQETKNETA